MADEQNDAYQWIGLRRRQKKGKEKISEHRVINSANCGGLTTPNGCIAAGSLKGCKKVILDRHRPQGLGHLQMAGLSRAGSRGGCS